MPYNHTGNQSCLCDWTSIKTLDTLESGGLLQLTIFYAYCHILLPGDFTLSLILLGKDKWKLHIWNFLGLCPMHIFPWLILFFHLINHNQKYNSFHWVLWTLPVNSQDWGWPWEPPNSAIGFRSKCFCGLYSLMSQEHWYFSLF